VALKHVLTPIRLGPVEVPNRVVRTGHGTGLGGGTMNDTLIAYHVARAKGGVGLTILEKLAIGNSVYPYLVAGAPGLVDGYRALMAQVKPYGMRVFQQMGHLGNEIPERGGAPPLSASDTVGALLGVPAEPMTHAQIDAFVDAAVTATHDCVEGGLDGVELHMAHGYLVQQFLSPLTNFRDDAYGGPFEHRLRFALELLTAVRGALPEHMALGVRLSSEALPGGMGPDDVARVAREFESRGLIDYLNLTIGTDYNPHRIIGAMHEPTGYELPYDAPVKRAVGVPVIVTGRFRTLAEADQVIGDGDADLVALTRAHIADPDLVSKTLAGREDEVRPCIGCNHGCIGGLIAFGRMGCTVNPAVGAEATLAEDRMQRADTPRRVLVVGGGPAGLEAARVAALSGHEVVLCEASGELGGAVNLARRAPRRIAIGDITEWLEREVFRLGVEVRLGTYVEREDVEALAPDAVVVATGSLPRLDGRQHLAPGLMPTGMDARHVLSSHDILGASCERFAGDRALVYDDAGHYEAVAVAEALVEAGAAVTFVTGHARFAPALEASLSAEPALERLARHDFSLMTYAHVTAVNANATRVEYRYGGDPVDVPADVVVFVSHNASNRALGEALDGWPGSVTLVGDARSPRYLQTAIREGHLAARAIA